MIINANNLAGLTTSFRATFNQAMATYGADANWDKVATMVPSTSDRNAYPFLGQTTRFREWLGDRQLQNLQNYGYTIANKTFENTVEVPRESIEDDQYGVYSPMFAQLGADAAAHPDELVFGLLAAGFATECYDGQFFFDTDHPVGGATVSNFGGGAGAAWYLLDTKRPMKPLVFQKRRDYKLIARDREDDSNVFERKSYYYGVDARVNAGYGLWQQAYASRQTLDETNLAAAIAAMKSVKGDGGRPLGIKPDLLVVGPTLEIAANKLLLAAYGANGATSPIPLTNKIQVLVSEYL